MRPSWLLLFSVFFLLVLTASPTFSIPASRSTEARQLVAEGLGEWKALDLVKAGELFERARGLALHTGDMSAEAGAHNGLGLVAQYQGKYQRALAEYRKALKIWPRTKESVEEAQTLANLGQVLLTLGQTDKALESYNQALALLRREDRRDVHLAVLDGAGMALHDLKAVHRALSTFLRALKLAETPGDEARIRGRLGNVYRDLGDLDQATEELEKARSLSHGEGNVRWESFMIADLAHIEDLRGRDQEALRLFDEAFELLEPLSQPLPQSSVLFGRAEVLRDLGRLQEAIESVERSMALVEDVRADLVDPGQRVTFFSLRQRYFELYVSLLMARYMREPSAGWEVKAFEASEGSHSRSLLDDVLGESRDATQGSTLAEIRRELGPDSTLLAYELGEPTSFLWVIDKDRITPVNLPSRREIEEKTERAWNQLSKAGGGSAVEALSRMVLPGKVGPLLRKHVLVSPGGALHKVPFAWLSIQKDRPLISDHLVSNVPAGSFLVGLRHKLGDRPPSPKQLAVLADPVFELDDARVSRVGRVEAAVNRGVDPETGHLERLVFSRKEARAILDLVPKDHRFEALGFQANRSTVLSPEMALAQIIHISTHHLAGEHPDVSGLILSRVDEHGHHQNGIVRASEIYQLHVPADLVVLSACETGLGPDVRGEGPIGMTRAFLHAGAKRVMVSLWNVDERSTTELMTRFYRNMLKDELSPAEALRSAQLSMAADHRFRRSPGWKAFVLQGEPR